MLAVGCMPWWVVFKLRSVYAAEGNDACHLVKSAPITSPT